MLLLVGQINQLLDKHQRDFYEIHLRKSGYHLLLSRHSESLINNVLPLSAATDAAKLLNSISSSKVDVKVINLFTLLVIEIGFSYYVKLSFDREDVYLDFPTGERFTFAQLVNCIQAKATASCCSIL